MSVTVPRRDATADKIGAIAVWSAAALCLLTILVTNVAVRVAGPDGLPSNPFTVTLGVLGAPGTPTIPWTLGCTLVAAALVAALTAPAVLSAVWLAHRRRRTHRVDAVTAHLADHRDLAPITRDGAAAVARRLGAPSDPPGLPLARTIHGDVDLFQDDESTSADIWGTRRGKALEASTPVLTPHGWVPIKDLARGCQVIGADGRPTTVTGVYPQGTRPAYRLHLSDGTSVLCDPDHLWTVRTRLRQDKKQPEMWRTWTTQQLLDNGLRRGYNGAARYYLPTVQPVRFEGVLPPGRPVEPRPPDGKGPNRGARVDRQRPSPVNLGPMPLDPYLLGVLIGDGSFTGASVTVSTGEADDLIPLLVLPDGVTARRKGNTPCEWSLRVPRGYSNSLVAALRHLDLMGHSALTKFIPESYLLAGVDTRRALLAGLLDTDGSIGEDGRIEFGTSSPWLAEDVRFLVQALGGVVSTSRRETDCAPAYRLRITLSVDAPTPFRLPRKATRWIAATTFRRCKQPVRAIVGIEPEGEADMVCISVAAPDGLFVTDQCIVTHNTTSRVIPGILAAPSWVLTTSSRRDVHDTTRGLREKTGTVHVFDPQGIVGEPRGMWWNPLSFVLSGPDGPEVKAQVLADIFAASAIPPDSKQDAYFDPEGTELLGHLNLAAAISGRDLRQVYLWVTNPSPTNTEPARLLEDRYPLSAAAVREAIRAPEKQRAGVFGAAKRRIWWMTATSAHDWIVPQPGQRQFDPDTFVKSTGTLYLLSRGGKGTLAALTTALAVAVCEAAEQRATRSPHGRLPVPGAVILDEVANTCRWPDLPEKFSYYGGSGIVLSVMLQSWAQGVRLWGENGMAQLWSAANIRVYGGGSAEAGFLRDLSELAGSYRPRQVSDTTSKTGRSVSHSEGKERVLSISDLTGLPKGRVLIFAGLPRPVLAAPVPWMNDPRAEEIRASIRRYDPAADDTLAKVDAERFAPPEPAATPGGAL